ncbi:PREDICTED: ATG8-interacting protein 2-like [Ipomoea nil]|uniref:ATG8-interacting protein 2-like n=1 Tax=Ipomoea nil TaxID=35883 RepID=UPI0009010745|nr:PREDICTED: ATG8-interacting protein 2-like [Ipomoea nil]
MLISLGSNCAEILASKRSNEIVAETSIPTVSNVRQDLTEFQERHAKLVLTSVKEISKLRYMNSETVSNHSRLLTSAPISLFFTSAFLLMGSNKDTEETTAHGNEWEVVSLIASAYAAALGSKQEDANDEHKDSGEYEAETSSALFMSGHFVFLSSQHENLPLKQENNEILTEKVVKEAEFVSAEEFEGDAVLQGLNLVDKEPSLYSAATYSSLHNEEHMLGSMVLDESSASNDPFESLQQISDLDILETVLLGFSATFYLHLQGSTCKRKR